MRRKRRKLYVFRTLFVLSVLAALCCSIAPRLSPRPEDISDASAVGSSDASQWEVPNGGLHSESALLVRLSDGRALMSKNSGERIYPASLTKIMTVMLAIERISNLQRRVTLESDMFRALYAADASMAGFLPGEVVPVKDLLYGAMLPSGAECCIGLADTASGSEAAFVRLMNQKAEKLGMGNTHFVNSTGLHDPNLYTTAEDLCTLLQYALQNATFRGIFTSHQYWAEPTRIHPSGITFCSTMFQNMKDEGIAGGSILGGKTGYTEQAGLCLASFARVGDAEYILVTAGAKGNHDTEQYNISDALLVYGELVQGESKVTK